MNIDKNIAALEVTADNKVIIRERVSILEKSAVPKELEIEANGEVTYETCEEDALIEKAHWYEQRTIKAGDDYSQECEKVKAVCTSVFSLL